MADASTTAVNQHKPQDEPKCTTTDATTSQAIHTGMNTENSPSTTTGIHDLDLASAQVVTMGSMGLNQRKLEHTEPTTTTNATITASETAPARELTSTQVAASTTSSKKPTSWRPATNKTGRYTFFIASFYDNNESS